MAPAPAAAEMGRVAKIASTLRTHWKKSCLAFAVGCYGVRKLNEKMDENAMMASFCREARTRGEERFDLSNPVTYSVTVILNPAADSARARMKYERYCEPLLHLAGFKVTAIRTEGQGQAKEIMESLEGSDAVLVAGGDGSLMEAVTGLMRRSDSRRLRKTATFGVLPVGANNLAAKRLFPGPESDARRTAEAAMAVVRQKFRPADVMQVKNVSDGTPFAGRKIYCVRQLQMGPWVDARDRTDRYWYLPGLKRYLTYIFTHFSSSPDVLRSCRGSLETGVAAVNEEEPRPQPEEGRSGGFWSYVFPASAGRALESEAPPESEPELSWGPEAETLASEIVVQVASNVAAEGGRRGMDLFLAPESLEMTQFVSEGWRRQRAAKTEGFSPKPDWRAATNVEALRWRPNFHPEGEGESEKVFYMDNEAIEIKGPIEVTVLEDQFRMFCADELHVPPAKESPGGSEGGSGSWLRQQKLQQVSVATKRLY